MINCVYEGFGLGFGARLASIGGVGKVDTREGAATEAEGE